MRLRSWLILVHAAVLMATPLSWATSDTDLPVNKLGHLTAHIPEGWITRHRFQSEGFDLLELLPAEQNHLNWQSKLIFERTRAAISFTPAQVLEQVDQGVEDNCYSFSRTMIFSGQENGVDSAVTLITCRKTKTDHQGLIQLSKAIWASPDWFFIKIKLKLPSYAQDDELKHGDLIKYWTTFLKKNTICQPGEAFSECRN
ncbi:MAG: hypothetical protein HOL98_15140 [Gammaproteobacteria bacterium]|jgi:hypothetical protein|nr:hypothetical protein [Gammaproteobacteria bacterium]MBT5204791.1 hypothetical protein [Gammaproteobacteria bacterium]MBT5603940.1 hypothetical protein [Gammaproteobacteria bacterium]MBT6244578.1 hypothetical protein [Gammaproteobacteria bacterium]